MARQTHLFRKWNNYLGIGIKLVLYILKKLFAEVEVNSGGYLPRRRGSVYIHRYSPPLLFWLTREACTSVVPFNPFTPGSDQYLISPAASQDICHHTVWGTWLFIVSSDRRWLYYQFLLPYLYIFALKGWENVLFELNVPNCKWQNER